MPCYYKTWKFITIIGPYTDPHLSCSYFHTMLLQDPFNIIIPTMSPMWSLSITFSNINFVCITCISNFPAVHSPVISSHLSHVKVLKEHGNVSCKELLILNVLYGLQRPHHSDIPNVTIHTYSWNPIYHSGIQAANYNSAFLLHLMVHLTHHNLLFVQGMWFARERHPSNYKHILIQHHHKLHCNYTIILLCTNKITLSARLTDQWEIRTLCYKYHILSEVYVIALYCTTA
jgi:hypothetical protein